MEVVKNLVEIISFMCNSEFWRMAMLWTLSLISSYMSLFYQTLFPQESRCYPRCSLKDSTFVSPFVDRPICIITGATSGLGAAAAHALAKEGFYVVLVGRSSEFLSQAVSEIKSRNPDAYLKAFKVDLSSFESILEFKHSLGQWLHDSNMHPSVQLLLNNAGILATSRRVTSEGYDQMLAMNYIGAFCLTKVLRPLLENSVVPSRVVNVSSFTHRNVCCRHADTETISGKFFMKSKYYPYASIYEYSKLCILLFSYELHRKVGLTKKSHHLSIVAADPGAVKTNIMREIPSFVSTMAYTAMKLLGVLQSSETGVNAIVDAALAPPEVSGVYFFGGRGRSLNSSALSYDAGLAKDLWDASCGLFEELQEAARQDGNCAARTDDIRDK
ncbi:dehydrogenase/reductase SDR family member on chromosome X-like [Salvia splendens]|uniref:dehydrogenase/reductase SDR family member on chromosome X-like n=1 Tax=Salvia splendens TaxID=180675 RepID=UPI001C273578|nr:dehydrogenase/reductase SDR family member on chromosome X-like [Salvia splendens]XP_042006962.1 dehydrogenase/reductase SDR family member on chromosome X-like [Salvia splendens]XP_042006963.1 dehydrogenase/reductase SDR family member on chromosome X-like [Salvia splendens]XP_042006964.1 dehydrogenase/reductase SDR family member on chromosome X-like [Salvia splendens]XP_042006965.1 dehydrogenase/reductase SDR family member on chromosome X-like [Salvia splendens]